MRSDSAPLDIYCSPAAAKVSPSYVYMAREESRGRLGASRRVTYRTCHTGNETSTRQLSSELCRGRRTGLLLAAVRKTRVASLVDGRGERAELCQPRIRRGAGEVQDRCREDAAPMARKRREAAVIARWAEAIAEMEGWVVSRAAPSITDSTAWATWFSGLLRADCLLLSAGGG
jgi:hypothetical protein